MSSSHFDSLSTRRIAPAPRVGGKDEREEPSRKRAMVSAACLQCQRRKCKCDGTRPVCQPCVSRRLECRFDVTEGTSQKDRIKQKYDMLESKYVELEALVAELTHSSEPLALDILIRMRAGEPIEDIIRSLSPAVTITDDGGEDQSGSGSSIGTDDSRHNIFDHPEQVPGSGSIVNGFALPPPPLLEFPGDGMNGSLLHRRFDSSNKVILRIFQPSPTRGLGKESLEQCLLQAVASQDGDYPLYSSRRIIPNWTSAPLLAADSRYSCAG